MRKLLLLIVVAAFAVSMPLSASALETSVHGIMWSTFNYSTNVDNYATGVQDDFNDDDDSMDARTYSYTRNNPRVYLKFSDDLEYVMGWDTLVQLHGTNAGTGGGAAGYGFGSYALTGSLTWHTRWVYMDFRVPNTPARVKVGIQTLRDPSGSILLLTGEFPSIKVDVPVGQGKLTAFWYKMGEGETGPLGQDADRFDNDADVYGAWVTWPVGENFTVTPQLFVAMGDDEHTCADQCIGTSEGYQGTTIVWFGANVKGKLALGANPIALNLNLYVATGDYDHTFSLGPGNSGDISGWLFEAKASTDLTLGNFSIKPEIIFLFSSGDSDLADSDREVFPSLNPYYTATQLFFCGFVNYLTAITNSPSGEFFRGNPGISSTANGITMFQVNAAIKPAAMKNLTIKPVVAFFMSTEDWLGYSPPFTGAPPIPNDDTYMGTEVGAEIIYQLYRNLRWHTYLGAFVPGDFYQYIDGDADDADTPIMAKTTLAVLF